MAVKDEMNLSEIRTPTLAERLSKLQHWRIQIGGEHLTTDAGGYDYDIPFDRIGTCAELLDWIFQIHTKTWASREVMGEMIEALRWLLNPQGHYCCGGIDQGKQDAGALVAAHSSETCDYDTRAQETR